jgi:hypothetical protein
MFVLDVLHICKFAAVAQLRMLGVTDRMTFSRPIKGLVCGVVVGTIFGGLWFASAYSDIDKVMLLPGEPRSNVVFSDLKTSLLIFILTGVPAGLVAGFRPSRKDTRDA